MNVLAATVWSVAVAGLAGENVPSQGDQLAVAAALEVLEHNKLTVLAAHKDTHLFWDDTGDRLSVDLGRPRSTLGKPLKNCVAKDIEVVPPKQINNSWIPADLKGEGLREVAMVINCGGSPPFYTRVSYRDGVLAKLQFIVDLDNE